MFQKYTFFFRMAHHTNLKHVSGWYMFQNGIQHTQLCKQTNLKLHSGLKVGDMGPLLVLVSPCFRENVVVTCKIESFLCSLHNLLQKKLCFFVLFCFCFCFCFCFFLKSDFKRAIFDLLFTFFSRQRKVTYISSAHFVHPIDFFCLTNFEKIYEFIRYNHGFSLV